MLVRGGRRGWPHGSVVGAAALLLTAVTAGCGGPPQAERAADRPPAAAPATTATTVAPGPGAPPQPAGQSFYVSDRTAAARQLPELRAQGRTAEADLIARLAGTPSAHWLTGGDDRAAVEELSRAAAAADRTALFVAYNIPQRDCGSFSAGGAPDAAAYRAWVDGLSAALADRRAWVVLEPDAVPHALDACGPKGAAAAERYALLGYAVDALKRHPAVRVYLDAGNPGWGQDRAALADALSRSGVGRADGFAVNVANFQGTDRSAAYGADLSAALGGAHFVIDTSRSGRGPLDGGAWCNPPGRSVGETPTERTGRPGVDAYLWVKIPGESDGDCGRGEPAAGRFWLEYALGLAAG
ncbi:glycoside hydrolase family 6 protein [Kitasatospora sp. NPDC057015]|uniref:glycoside hydrolase family 6 protein n=1 Tax=Kitasatospora sp. NPDC057015 TaxID=3346001 RepID=UPI003627256E